MLSIFEFIEYLNRGIGKHVRGNGFNSGMVNVLEEVQDNEMERIRC